MTELSVHVTSGLALVEWDDAGTEAVPSRLNPVGSVAHRYYRADPEASVQLQARIAGVAVADAGLASKLIAWSWVEYPGGSPPPISTPSGFTRDLTIALGPTHIGHYCILAQREDSGRVLFHFDVEEA